MGPESATSFPGPERVPAQGPAAPAQLEPRPAAPSACPSAAPTTAMGPSEPARATGRAVQELDYGRRGKGSIFGACKPADGAALTAP
jgi:hypothetical protein